MQYSRCCKPLFSCTLARGESYPPKFQCMTTDVETTSFLTISKRAVLTTQTPLHDSRCCKPLLPCPLAKGESYPTNYQCMTTDVETTSLLTNSKGGVLPTQTPVHYSLCCKPLLSIQTPVHDSRCCKPLFPQPISKGGVLPTKTPVHDSRCCKPLLP